MPHAVRLSRVWLIAVFPRHRVPSWPSFEVLTADDSSAGATVSATSVRGRCRPRLRPARAPRCRAHTRRFADLAAAVAKLSARSLVLDAEVAIFDEQLRSRFDWLRGPDPDAVATPPLLIVFDLNLPRWPRSVLAPAV